MDDVKIHERQKEITKAHGEWTAHNIQLRENIWTIRKEEPISRVRARRYLQIASDMLQKPFTEMRVLDLGCLEGVFGIEFAAQGATSLLVDGRESNLVKARFAAEVLNLTNVDTLCSDVRELREESIGTFDCILCLGILYHLDSCDILPFLKNIAAMSTGPVIIDTHISLHPTETFEYEGVTYSGSPFQEYESGASSDEKEEKTWAAIANEKSFWLSEPSLFNALHAVGFTTVSVCEHPPVITTPQDRKTYIALRGTPVSIAVASPRENPFPYEFSHKE